MWLWTCGPNAAQPSQQFANLVSVAFSAFDDFELPGVTAKEMTWLYENRMVGKKAPAGKKAPGRLVYDSIRTAGPQGRCPLCGHRDVTTVDHYLPKSAYAALAVNRPTSSPPAASATG